MNKFEIQVVNECGFPLEDIFFQKGAKCWVSGRNGKLTLEYESETENVRISGLLMKNAWVPISFLLDLPDHILVIGKSGVVMNLAQKEPQAEITEIETTVAPIMAKVKENDPWNFSLWPLAILIGGLWYANKKNNVKNQNYDRSNVRSNKKRKKSS